MAEAFQDPRLQKAPLDAILVMGIAGTGKSAIAGRLAAALGADLIEADSYHSPGNVERMRQGIGLADADRWPWLAAVAEAARATEAPRVIIACSALKRSYRDFLRDRIGPLSILYLEGAPELIATRLAGRNGHFATGSLLESQMRTLEPPGADEKVVHLDIRLSPDAIVAAALARLENGRACDG